ncbi:alpha/beta fold hydrolase [Streptacidiphilus jiangxiensis]|uniref:Pimeloyl-ACP methyl ester carboxylesterase n=1 Tax=Streptacidiphilus jiangxiensis TaxID=235985 RepID=A0A1H7FU78_STRJI|nr:alpha/beta hydrolase [Streptacidiphilus jiangxiensis]SEK29656.1 Pimeloyl-ACP methyl ester carboxylesterase [Streptacidiphilus jiangxiensis]
MSGLRETFEVETTTGPGGLREVRVPGSRLFAEAQPPRRAGLPAALFVHGLGGSTRNWELLMAELADTVDGQAVDLPGFGQSPPPDDADLSLDAHVRAVVDHLDRGGRGPVHLFGNSLGGAVTTRIAALRPDLVRSLTLISPALPELPPQTMAWPTGLLALPGAAGVIRRASRGTTFESQTQSLLELCYGDPGRIPPERRAVMVAEYRRRAELPYSLDVLSRSARGIIRAYTERGAHSLWRQAERVTAPTLLVYGLKDRLVGYRMARRASQAFADSRLLVLPEAGHVAMMEFPELVAARVEDFLAEVAAKGAEPC